MNKKVISALLVTAISASLLSGCGGATGGSGSAANADTSSYPERAIEAIIAFDPGGGSDIAARSILSYTEKYLGGTFAIENRPGAGGIVGWTAIATGEPDGYTLGMINLPSIIFNPITMGDQVNYSMDDFAPIANFVSDPGTMAVVPDSDIQSFQDMIDAANPSTLMSKDKAVIYEPGTLKFSIN